MKWITRELVLAIHARQIAEHGGGDAVRDDALLESALGRPQQLYAYAETHPVIPALAASISFGIARNLPFVDGNKRTAFVSLRTFLLINGVDIVASQQSKFETTLALSEGTLSEAELVDWIRHHLKPDESEGIHEPNSMYSTG